LFYEIEDEWLAREDVLRDKTLAHFALCRLVDPFHVSSVSGDPADNAYFDGLVVVPLG
jgi:hypothetical protein